MAILLGNEKINEIVQQQVSEYENLNYDSFLMDFVRLIVSILINFLKPNL